MRPIRWIVLVGVVAGCGAPEAGPASTPPTARVVFERPGVPGPWWRRGATAEDFEREHRVCLEASRRARRGAEDPAEAAYRGFLDCMQDARWRRGLPPPPGGAG